MSGLWSLYAGACGALVVLAVVVTAASVAWAYRAELRDWLDRPGIDTADRARAEAEARAYHPSARSPRPTALPVNGRAVCTSCTIVHQERHLDIRPLVSPVGGLLEAWVCPTCGYDNVYRAPALPVRGDVR